MQVDRRRALWIRNLRSFDVALLGKWDRKAKIERMSILYRVLVAISDDQRGFKFEK